MFCHCQSAHYTQNQRFQNASTSAGYSNKCMNKHGQRDHTSEDLTNNMQRVKHWKSKRLRCQLKLMQITSDSTGMNLWVQIISGYLLPLMIATRRCLKLVNAWRCFDQVLVISQIYWQASQSRHLWKRKKTSAGVTIRATEGVRAYPWIMN